MGLGVSGLSLVSSVLDAGPQHGMLVDMDKPYWLPASPAELYQTSMDVHAGLPNRDVLFDLDLYVCFSVLLIDGE